jgi:hypothetical protein
MKELAFPELRQKMPRFEVELAASHGIKLEVSKREPVEQTVIDPILAFVRSLATATVDPRFSCSDRC